MVMLLSLLLTALAAEPAVDEAAGAPAPLDVGHLRAVAEKVRPLVEKHAGRSFKALPAIDLAEGASFAAVVEEENRLIYDRVFSASPEAVRHKLAADASRGTQHAVLGKYGIFTDTLYMSEGPLRMAAATLKGDRLDDVITVIMAHELAHALQDQHIPMDGLIDALDDQDALWAASGSWEGFATLVEQRVAHELGLDDVFWTMTRLQGWGPKGLEEPLAFQTWAVYGQGRRFAEHHAKGGPDALWTMLAAPPQRTSMLFAPASWVADPPPAPVDFSPALVGTEHTLTSKKEWASLITALGELELRGEAILGHTEAELDEVMKHLVYAQKLEGALPDRGVEARVLLFDDPSWPRRYLDLLRAQAQAEATRKGDAFDVPIELSYEAFPLEHVATEDSTLRTTRVPIGGGRHLETRSAWVVRDRMVLVVTAERFRPGLRLGWAIEHLMKGLDGIALP